MPSVTFKRVSFDDLDSLRKWRNTQRIKKNMFNTKDVSKSQQLQWFEALERDNSQQQFVCFLDDEPYGILNFTNINENECEWGCYVGQEHIMPGFGLVLAACALEYAFDHLAVKCLKAQVLSHNKAPQKIHHFFKYQQLGDRVHRTPEGENITVHCYQYQTDDWDKNRTSVYALLPKHLRVLVSDAQFNQGTV